LTLGDIFFLKDFLAHHLRIKRHWFSLRELGHEDQRSFLTWSILAPLKRHCEHFFHQKSQTDEELCQNFERSLSELSVDSIEFYLRHDSQNSVRYPRVSLQWSPHCVSMTKEPVLPGNPTMSPQRSPHCVSMRNNEPVLPGKPTMSPQRSPHCVIMTNEPVLPGSHRSSPQKSPHFVSKMEELGKPSKCLSLC